MTLSYGGVQSPHHGEDQDVLAGRQPVLLFLEEPASGTGRIVIPVFKPKNRSRPPVRHPGFASGGEGPDKLFKARQETVPIPIYLGSKSHPPWSLDMPAHG